MTTVALTVIALAATAAPAHADATVRDNQVSLSVTGKGLMVRHAGGWIDHLGTGVRARLCTTGPGGRRHILTRWKDATPLTSGLARVSMADWKLNRRFGAGTWLCIEFNHTDGTPCAPHPALTAPRLRECAEKLFLNPKGQFSAVSCPMATRRAQPGAGSLIMC
ncbi:hypothetical protein [Streptomyces sp. NPDC005423]|uniref:hypothetical protein n=1 Tax=Streptomyces sp. NPDC005423 TaxID=3155343 RepID=UPI0033A71C55